MRVTSLSRHDTVSHCSIFLLNGTDKSGEPMQYRATAGNFLFGAPSCCPRSCRAICPPSPRSRGFDQVCSTSTMKTRQRSRMCVLRLQAIPRTCGSAVLQAHSLVIALLAGLLGRLLLLLVLALASVSRQRLLQNFENLLVFNLLVRLELAQVQGRRSTKLGDAVLGDGFCPN